MEMFTDVDWPDASVPLDALIETPLMPLLVEFQATLP
jgi:hypothetical protein